MLNLFRAEQSRAEQSRAEQSRAEQSRAEQSRAYSLDFLRIVAMYAIFLGHYLQHGNAVDGTFIAYGSFNYYVTWLIWSFWRFAVDVFPIITGYFLINKTEIKWSKCIAIIAPILFYSWTYLFLAFFINIDLSTKEIIKYLLPIKSNIYWFMSAYIGMYIFHPYLNRIVKIMDEAEYRKFLFIGIALLSIYSFTGFGIESPFGTNGDNMLWLIQMYFVGGYIRIYNMNFRKPFSKYILCSLSLFFIFIVLRSFDNDMITKVANDLYRNNSPFIVFSAICMFVGFRNLKISSKYFISIIKHFSPLMFGAYLIHEHPMIFTHTKIWQDYMRVGMFSNEIYWGLYVLLNSILVFLLLVGLEWIRSIVADWLKNVWGSKSV